MNTIGNLHLNRRIYSDLPLTYINFLNRLWQGQEITKDNPKSLNDDSLGHLFASI